MKFNELVVAQKQSTKRVGRGISAGQGKTAGRGTKGQKSRTGSKTKSSFAGGQTPLMKRMPKLRGFTSHRTPAEIVYTGALDNLGVNVDNFVLAESGITSSPYVKVKLILKGDVTKKHTINLQGASKNSIEAVKKAGGTFTQTDQVARTKQEKPE